MTSQIEDDEAPASANSIVVASECAKPPKNQM